MLRFLRGKLEVAGSEESADGGESELKAVLSYQYSVISSRFL